jgi:hypothetical protein
MGMYLPFGQVTIKQTVIATEDDDSLIAYDLIKSWRNYVQSSPVKHAGLDA